MKGKEVQILKKEELNTGMLMWADQILVATNAMRTKINDEMRQLLGRGDAPEDGDKVICCRNYWECISSQDTALINGAIGTLKNSFSSFVSIPSFITADRKPKQIDTIRADFIGDCGEDYGNLCMDKRMILEGSKALDWKTEYKLMKMPKYMSLVPMEFTYAYAITCHKSQGSEWDKVLVLEEKFPFDKEEHARWLYTACTRAAEKLVLIR